MLPELINELYRFVASKLSIVPFVESIFDEEIVVAKSADVEILVVLMLVVNKLVRVSFVACKLVDTL
jgi:hypothetical protein